MLYRDALDFNKTSKSRCFLYNSLDVARLSEEMIERKFSSALSMLESLDVAPLRKEAIRQFSIGLMNRKK